MTRTNYSRLAKTETKRAIRSIVLYIALSIGLLILLFVFGIPAMGKLTNIIVEFTNNDQPLDMSDGPPPAPPILNPPTEFQKDRKLVVNGTTQPGYTVIIHLNDERKEIIAGSDGNFSTSFSLNDGKSSLYASVTNNAGKESTPTRTYDISFDSEPPKLEIISPENDKQLFGSQNRQQKIEGQTESEAFVTINDHVSIVRTDGKFDFPVSLNEGTNEFKIKSQDKAGNVTELTYTLHFGL